MSSTDAATKPRDRGIDAVRYLAAVAVVGLHALPSGMEDGANVPLFPSLAISARFAVPFFFIAAGYFQKVNGVSLGRIVGRPLRRLLPIYVIWIALYWLASRIVPLADMDWNMAWWKIAWGGGPVFHLWFLPALGFGLALVGIGRATIGLRATTAIAILLALADLAWTSYHAPLFGGDAISARKNTFFAPAFIVLGAWLSHRQVALSPLKAGLIALAGLALLTVEEVLLRDVMGWSIAHSHDVSFGTFLYGAGIFLLARSWRDAAVPDWLVRLGQVSLGVYILHLFFQRALIAFIGNASLGQVALLASVSLILATAASLLLVRVPGMRRLVS